MIIHDPEAFELWLATTLEPLCDADPAALAKYVCALVKKEKPLTELRATMIQQLDVFLLLKTQSFVDRLIKMLETQSNDPPKPPLPKTPVAAAPPPPPELPPAPESHPPPPPAQAELPLAYQPVNGSVAPHRRDERSRSRHGKPDMEKESDKGGGRRRHNSPGRAARSRSKSWDRQARRSRSRERDRETRRERDRSRAWRNKSPPPRRPYDRERRRSWSNSPGDAPRNHSRSRSRSPRPLGHHRGRYRNRSPPLGAGSKSRTRSPDHKEPVSGGGTPTQDSNHGDVDMRLTTTSQSIQSVVGKANEPTVATGTFQGKGRCYDFDEKGYCMQGDLCQFDHGVDPVVLEDVALSNMLTFGPTPPPPGTGAGPMPRMPPAPAPQPGPPGEPSLARGPRPNMQHGGFQQHRAPPPTGNMEYNPDAPAMEPRGMTWVPRPSYRGGRGMRGPRPMHYHAAPQRELISVPVQGEEPYQPYGRGGYNSESKDMGMGGMGMKKRPFDFARLGPRHKTPHNCSLELKKVPRGLNNITHLNNHFAKFGKIVNIQVSFESDPEAALVTFSSHAEANAAYRSTEAVLNNRFIKVFWHVPNNNNNNSNDPGKQVQENVPPPSRQSVKERLGAPPSLVSHNALQPIKQEQGEPTDKVVIADGTITKTVYIPTALKKTSPLAPPVIKENKANTAAAVKRSQDLLEARVRIKRLQQNKQKDSIKLSMNLRKRKQTLLDNHIKQLNRLIECAEKKGQNEEQKGVLMSTIRQVQATVERLRKELQGAVSVAASLKSARAVVPPVNRLKMSVLPVAASTPVVTKTKEQAQREILDAELDLYTRQQEGGDTTELQRRVNELKMESGRLLGLTTTPRGGRGRGGPGGLRGAFRGRVRTSYNMAHSSVDHRPTRVLVSGYENDEKVDVITHFRQYGEISDFACDDATPSVILNYKTRKEAESALLKGRNFQDRVLSVTWCTQQSARGHVMSTVLLRHRSMSMASGADESQLLCEDVEEEEDAGLADYNEDLLLQDDEEEEEDEDEEKSWRR